MHLYPYLSQMTQAERAVYFDKPRALERKIAARKWAEGEPVPHASMVAAVKEVSAGV
jgi:hypothetical protein